MRILVVHERYRERGGEDAAVDAEVALLRRNGHDVQRLDWDNRDIPKTASPSRAIKMAARAVWSSEAARRVAAMVETMRAEVVHFHNTFPLVSPAVYAASGRNGAAVVQTLHNYRLICPNGLLFRDGRPCEDCVGKSVPWPGVVHRCYRSSRAQTAAVVIMLATHNLRRTWNRDVNAYVALSKFSRDKFVEGGLAANKVLVKANFLDPDPGWQAEVGTHFLFSGRLVDYKGIVTLLRAWKFSSFAVPLKIAGDGPLITTVREAVQTLPNVSYLGRLDRPSMVEQLRGALAVVLPSLCYENFPLAIVEAFACGRPVIGPRHGAVAELVTHEETGLLFEPGSTEDLAAKLRWAQSHGRELQAFGAKARLEYEQKYTARRGYERLLEVYDFAREQR